MKIRRTKTGQGGPDALPPSTSVLWAAGADGDGRVTAWLSDEAQARDFDDAACERVREQYAARPNAGLIEFVGGRQESQAAEQPPLQVPPADREPPGVANVEEHLGAFRAAAARANKDRPGAITPAAVKAKLKEIREYWAAKAAPPPPDEDAPPPSDGA